MAGREQHWLSRWRNYYAREVAARSSIKDRHRGTRAAFFDAVTVSAADEERIVARERLNFLAIGFYVRGAIMLVFSCFFLIYVAVLLSFSFIPESAWNQPPHASASPSALVSATPAPAAHVWANSGAPPVMFFRIMAGVMGVFVVLGWTAGALTLYSGSCIKKRKHRVLVYVMAALNCFFIPYGTLLGVFTFIVLGSPEAIAEWNDPSL
jgi:hypothetical protein